MYVPGGWWHVVLNLTDTIAVTQNFCSEAALPIVWHKTMRGRPKFAKHWLKALKVSRTSVTSSCWMAKEALQTARPDLAAVCESVDTTSKSHVASDSSSSDSSSSSSEDSGDSDSDSDARANTPDSRKRLVDC